jgi:predicted RNA-binding protein with TRAM domain
VEPGKEYDVEISEISRQGDGIARVQGFVIFVKGGRVGQKARVRITNIGARFATAELVTGGAASSTGEAHDSAEIAPQVPEAEKPELQDYKSGEEKPSEPASGG